MVPDVEQGTNLKRIKSGRKLSRDKKLSGRKSRGLRVDGTSRLCVNQKATYSVVGTCK